MKRAVVEFRTDAEGQWMARLGCGHRHDSGDAPPETVDCARCDAFELPTDFVPYRRTAVFTESSIPAGLLEDHSTKAGVWARIVVVEGTLRYHVESLGRTFDLTVDHRGIVISEVRHHVAAVGPVRFFVEFLRAAP